MKHLKMLGLVVIATGALTAFAGAGSASADVLCTTNTTNACASGWRVTHIEMSQVGTGTLKTTGGTTLETCTGTSLTFEDTEGSATHEPGGPVSSLTWTGCTTTRDTLAGGNLRIETKETAGGVHDNTVVSSGLKWTTQLFGVSCVYGTGAGTSLGDLTTGEPAVLHINAVVLRVEGGGLCPASGRWEATFQITNHTAVWPSKE